MLLAFTSRALVFILTPPPFWYKRISIGRLSHLGHVLQAIEILAEQHEHHSQDHARDSRPPSVESVSKTMHRLKPESDNGMLNRPNSRAWSPSPMRRSHSPQPHYRYLRRTRSNQNRMKTINNSLGGTCRRCRRVASTTSDSATPCRMSSISSNTKRAAEAGPEVQMPQKKRDDKLIDFGWIDVRFQPNYAVMSTACRGVGRQLDKNDIYVPGWSIHRL